MLNKHQPQAAFLALFDCEAEDLQAALAFMQLPVALDTRWRRGPEKTRWDLPHVRQLALAWCRGARVQPLAEQFGRKPGSIYAKARQMGLPKRRRAQLQAKGLPLFDFVAARPALALAPLPDPVPALLDWSDMVGVADHQPEQVLLPDLEPDPFPENVVELALVPEPDPEPEPVRELPVLRKMSIPIPAGCRGFEGPKTLEDFRRFSNRMANNTLGSIRCQLRTLDLNVRQDAQQDIFLALTEWFEGESPKYPGRPRYLNYDPSKNLEFWQWYIKQIRYKALEFWKGMKRVRDSGVTITTWDADDEIDTLLEGDTTAAIAMRSVPVPAENAVDFGNFVRTARRISEHHAGATTPRFRAAASFATILHGIRHGNQPEEMRHRLQSLDSRTPISLDNVKSWRTELFKAAEMFRNRGERGVLAHYGVPA